MCALIRARIASWKIQTNDKKVFYFFFQVHGVFELQQFGNEKKRSKNKMNLCFHCFSFRRFVVVSAAHQKKLNYRRMKRGKQPKLNRKKRSKKNEEARKDIDKD